MDLPPTQQLGHYTLYLVDSPHIAGSDVDELWGVPVYEK